MAYVLLESKETTPKAERSKVLFAVPLARLDRLHIWLKADETFAKDFRKIFFFFSPFQYLASHDLAKE